MKIVLAAVLAAALALPAAAQTNSLAPYYSRTYNLCVQQAVTAGADLVCTKAELKRWTDEINATYKQVMANLPPAQRASLLSEERTWVARKDSGCRKSGGAVQVQNCLLDETILRTLYLRTLH